MASEEGTKNAIENNGVIFLVLIFFFFIFVKPEILPSEIGSYPALKQADESLMPLNRTIYKVNPLLHTIIYWMPGMNETPQKLTDCVVRDRKNWIGYYSDGSGYVEMSKGKIITEETDEVYIGKYHWWLRHFLSS